MAQEPERLATWGEIAKFLNCNVRTAQRHAIDRGLPVRRLPGGRKGSVFAYRHELQNWIDSRHAAVAETPASSRSGISRRTLLPVSAAAALLAGAGFWSLRRQPEGVVRAAIVGNTLCAWDDMGRFLWKYPFPEALDTDPHPHQFTNPILADVLSDGSRQVLFTARFARPPAAEPCHELFCFSGDGKVLWRYKPKLSLTFGNQSFHGPWSIHDVLFHARDKSRRVWVALSHWVWRPGAVVSIDPRGQDAVHFVQGGNIYSLSSSPSATDFHLLAGGINNEYAAASVAVLRADAPPSRSPQTNGTRFECVNGPAGSPEKYFLLPPTEVNAATGRPYNIVSSIFGGERGFQVRTEEGSGDSSAQAFYGLSESLEVTDVSFDDNFAVRHQLLEKAGRIHHNLSSCPLLNGPKPIRRWNEASGWTDVSVPLKAGVWPDGRAV